MKIAGYKVYKGKKLVQTLKGTQPRKLLNKLRLHNKVRKIKGEKHR